MKLNTWYRVGYKNFYRYYFTQLEDGNYFGVEYNEDVKAVVVIDSWPGFDTEKEIYFDKPIFSRDVYEKKMIESAFKFGDVL